MDTLTIEAPVEKPVEAPAPLKLSEAMRIGAAASVQAIGNWIKTGEDGDTAMCALSTAWWVLTDKESVSAMSTPLLHMLDRVTAEHPVSHSTRTVSSIVVSLNDDHRWNRRRIADWLASIGL